jgi:flagellar motor switch protein FliG
MVKSGNPGSADGFLKTGPEESKYRRVAKFLILIGGEQASQILSHLEASQVEAVSREIASIRGITAEEGEAVLDEFRSLLSAPYGCTGNSSGGAEAARRLLYAAYGPEKGEEILNKSVPESRENLFAFLEDFSPEQVCLLLKDEAPPAAALILSLLSAKFSAAVLANTGGARKLDIVRRIAHQGEVSPEVLGRVAQAVKEKARHIGRSGADTERIDGRKALAAILRGGDYSFGDKLLGELEEEDPELGRDLKERLYTLDDVIKAGDRSLQAKLASMREKDIAMLLKGRPAGFAAKILANVSVQRAALIREEGEILGAVSRKDADKAAAGFLSWFRKEREEGRILMLCSDDVVE